MKRFVRSALFALLALSVILVGGIVEATNAAPAPSTVKGSAWVIESATPSPTIPSDPTAGFAPLGPVDATLTLDKLIAVFQGMSGGDRAVTLLRSSQAAAAISKSPPPYPDIVLTPKAPVKPGANYTQGTMWIYDPDMLSTSWNLSVMWAYDVAFFFEAGPYWNIPGYGMTPPDAQPQKPGVARIAVYAMLPPAKWCVIAAAFQNFSATACSTWYILSAPPPLGTLGPWYTFCGTSVSYVPVMFFTSGAPGGPNQPYTFYFDKAAGSTLFRNVTIKVLF